MPDFNGFFKETVSFFNQLEKNKAPIVGAIPCFCKLSEAKGDYLEVFKDSSSSFNRTVEEIALKIENDSSINLSRTNLTS